MSTTDLRIRKTYAALTQAFTDLLKEKSFEQITVRELCDRALVRTATFYNHFSDKYEFADFMIRDLLQRYHRDRSDLGSLKGTAYYDRLLDDAFALLESSTEMIRSLASDAMLWSISEVVRNSMHDELLAHLKADDAAGHELAAPPEYLTECIIGAVEQTVRWWFADTTQKNPANMKQYLRDCILRLVG